MNASSLKKVTYDPTDRSPQSLACDRTLPTRLLEYSSKQLRSANRGNCEMLREAGKTDAGGSPQRHV